MLLSNTDRRYPSTKSQAQEYENERISWGIAPEAGKVVISYLNDLGAKSDMPKNKQEQVKYVNDYHRSMTLRNEYMPKDIPFHLIYPPFFSAVMNGFVEVPDFQPWTIKNQLKAFKKWITKGGQLDKLYKKFYREYPDKAPKQIAPKSTNLERWSDAEIKDQYEKITMIYGEFLPVFKTIGADAYCKRIETEHQKRGL